ncbi:MAG: LCP family protein [Nostoc sp.]|uniref:LCP family protein n=1 Tax=Nostoc sp. TaxID=1180 RepID=UPI002FFC72F0
MKQRNNPKKSQFLKQPFTLAMGAAVVAATSGAIFSSIVSLTPLKNDVAFDLPGSSKSVTGLIPATLDHPVNILILGIDNSGHPHEKNFTPAEALAGNSDTMLLAQIKPDSHSINILSIPRDTLVKFYGVGIDKINDANVRGGTKLAAQSVSQLLDDVSIDRYVRLDTEGFIHLVDALGGVEVSIPKKMDYVDHSQNLNIHFLAGVQKLSGQHLEEYIRFRHDALGDIGRVQRQQQVLKDILITLLQPQTITKLPQILKVAQDNIDTDLSINEMLAIAQTLAQSNHHNFMLLPGRFSEKSEYNVSYWISDHKATKKILQRYFNFNNAEVKEEEKNLAVPPGIKIFIQNATRQPEAVGKVTSLLEKHGFRNIFLSSHEIDTDIDSAKKTRIIAQHGNPEAANAVEQALGVGDVEVASLGDIASDVTVVIGTDLTTSISENNSTYIKQNLALQTRQKYGKLGSAK